MMVLFCIRNKVAGNAAELLSGRRIYSDLQMLTGTVSQRNWSENDTTAFAQTSARQRQQATTVLPQQK